MTDFWHSCGHHFLDRDGSGGYAITDDFLKVYLARPELIPPPDACSAERKLHAALIADPRRSVTASEIMAIAETDARENWEILIAFRDHLMYGPRTAAKGRVLQPRLQRCAAKRRGDPTVATTTRAAA